MKRLIPILEVIERTVLRAVGAVLSTSMAVLTRLMRRGKHRTWRQAR